MKRKEFLWFLFIVLIGAILFFNLEKIEPTAYQEEIAKDLCLNTSTVARALNYLEVNGYILRTPLPTDKRQFSVHPTDKALGVLPEIRQASREWRDKLAEGISNEEMEIFNSVLERMEKRAREITQSQEAAK